MLAPVSSEQFIHSIQLREQIVSSTAVPTKSLKIQDKVTKQNKRALLQTSILHPLFKYHGELQGKSR